MIDLDELAETSWFTFLVHENLERLRFVLNNQKPGQKYVIVGISYDDDSRNGPRTVGIAFIGIEADSVVVRYLVKQGDIDALHRYRLSLDTASDIVADLVGTREAMNFRRLST